MTPPDAIGLAGLITAGFSVTLARRQRTTQERAALALKQEMHEQYRECLLRMSEVAGRIDAAERSVQSSAELLQDGRLSLPVRSRALRMIRSGMAPDSIAVEMGLPRAEMRLLAKVAVLLAPES